MSTTSRRWQLAVVGVLVAGAAFGVAHGVKPGVTRTVSSRSGLEQDSPAPPRQEHAAQLASSTTTASEAPVTVLAFSEENAARHSAAEPSTLEALHELLRDDPETALAFARNAVARSPRGADAAEQTWVIVRALTALGRFDEARAEAVAMVNQYPDSSWSRDVVRHVLSNP